MNIKHLIFRNIFLYKSFYRLIAVAVIVAVAVITGSLVVGDSVRSTLIKRVEERLGKTETIIFSRYSYISDAFIKSHNYASLRGFLLSNGFVSISGKFIPVMVWGTDDLEIKKGQAKINAALFNEIKNLQIKNIVLRLPAAGMVPLGSMFVTDTYTTSLRLELDAVISVEQGGNINLKNEQTIPFNIFVNREELAEIMGISGKINVILSDEIISKEDFASAWNYIMSGLNVEALDERAILVTSDRIFIQDKVVETLCQQDSATNRIYAYLANSIAPVIARTACVSLCDKKQAEATSPLSGLNSQLSIPYSFITAVDYYKGQRLNPNEIILSDYAAKRLNTKLGDTISISYFVSRQFKTLIEDTVSLKVGKIVPLKDLQSDNTLVAEFPGLSNVDRCTDWNSDLPINMNLISDEDENYWRKYKNTPKAIVPYSTLASRWGNAYGSATALQVNDTNRLNDLRPEMFDIQLIYPRETGITAAKLGVDFASLFLSLGFFIIISAAMLMMVPLSEMLFRRRNELNLLKATGFSQKRIFRLLWREAAPVVCFSAIVGVVVGLVYTYLVLFLLGNVWKGATHTDGFSLYPNLLTIGAGMLVGIIFSMIVLCFRISKFKIQNPKSKNHKSQLLSKFLIFNFQFSILVGLLITNIFFLKSPLLFVCTGIVFLFTGWAWFDYLINRGTKLPLQFDSSKLIWSSLFFTKKQAILSFITLASGVFIVFSVGLNRQGFADSSQIRTATG
ncbi:MAG: FtsX-like permease family protein, partial [Prevotellaceae bacterium]|nr:FtsX-like permease family protein [Prevotellaceae bacterium]